MPDIWGGLKALAAAVLSWLAGFLAGEEHEKRKQSEAENAELHRQLDIASRPDDDIATLLEQLRSGKL
jgi:hypothetical protein